MLKCNSGELIEMHNTLSQDECESTTNNIAMSLVRRGYADIEWLISALEENNADVNCRDADGRPLLQVLLEVPWKGQESRGLEEGIPSSILFKLQRRYVLSYRCKIADWQRS